MASSTNILDGLKKELRREDLNRYSNNLIKLMHSDGRDKFLDTETPIKSYKYREINDFTEKSYDLNFNDGSRAVGHIDLKNFEAQQSFIE